MTGRTPAHVDPAEVARLAADGLGRNACARHLGVSRRAVDTAAQAAGITWDRTATEAATRARVADVRASLAADFADIADGAAERLLDALDRDDLDPRAIQALASVSATSVDLLTALADRLAPADDDGTSLLDQLRQGVDEWHASLNDQTITVTEHNTTGETQ